VSLHADRSACKPVIRGELTGSSTCSAAGLIATSATPVLALCRELVSAGFNPDQPLDVYRGATLALRIRSIGEAAKLAVEDNKTGRPTFRRRRDRPARDGAAPPISETAPGAVEIRGSA
jgi:hypothetical protein